MQLMSEALRKLACSISKLNCVAIFINQLREKVGVLFGNPETTPGGRALKFYSSVRIDIRKIETLKAGGEVVGSRTRAKVVKNKIAPPFREAEFDIMYGQGISRVGELLDLAVNADVIKKSGAWFSYDGNRIAQGRDNAKNFLRDNPEIAAKVEEELKASSDKLNFSKTTKARAKALSEQTEEKTENAVVESEKTETTQTDSADVKIDTLLEE